jgi:NhaP-type Na+/H+ and K+/H+ antiporter
MKTGDILVLKKNNDLFPNTMEIISKDDKMCVVKYEGKELNISENWLKRMYEVKNDKTNDLEC